VFLGSWRELLEQVVSGDWRTVQLMQLRSNKIHTSGLTLMELVVVVGILAFMAGLVAYNITPSQMTFGGAAGNKTAGRIATEATMSRVKSAIFGSADSPGYWQDMNRDMWYYPMHLEWLSRAPTERLADGATDQELAYISAMMSYSPSRRVGWRGPYVQFQGDIIPLDPARGFTARLGGGAYRSPIDAWGNPVVMQLPTEIRGTNIVDYGDARGDADMAVFIASNSRLVSAGPDGILQTQLNIESLQTFEAFQTNALLAGDDIVIWLQH
jgi:type II secretory pathway pseudopilin PulG